MSGSQSLEIQGSCGLLLLTLLAGGTAAASASVSAMKMIFALVLAFLVGIVIVQIVTPLLKKKRK